jgi:hypothetical protein
MMNWVRSSHRGSGMVKAGVSSCHRFLALYGARSPSSSNLTDSDYPRDTDTYSEGLERLTTHASLKARAATTSTPFSLIAFRFSM